MYRNSYARAKALRKWTSWEMQCIKVSEFKLPEAKQTKNGVYLAKTDSSLNLNHHFLAIPPSSTPPILPNRRRYDLAKWRNKSRLLLWYRFWVTSLLVWWLRLLYKEKYCRRSKVKEGTRGTCLASLKGTEARRLSQFSIFIQVCKLLKVKRGRKEAKKAKRQVNVVKSV